MFHSLRLRLFLVMLLVVMVFVATTAFFASRMTVTEFQHYLEYDDTAHQQRVNEVLVGLLQTYYTEHRRWDGVQTLLEQLGEVTSTRIILADQYGLIVADSRKEALGRILPLSRINKNAYLLVENTLAGAVVVYGSPWIKPGAETGPSDFVGSVNHYLIVTVLAVGAVALLLTLALAHRISKPMEALTLAVRNLGKGDLHQRVKIRSKDEIGELATAFNAMADHLAQIEQLRRNLVSDVAHELRTPLSCILGYLEALQDGVAVLTPELIASLYEEATLLRRLVIDLQELALADTGHLKLVRRPVFLAELAEQAVGIFQPQAINSDLMIKMDIPPDLPSVDADSERIGQVLRNLLKNAITYTPEQGEITIKAAARDSEIQVTVADTGIGIEPEHLPYLFDRFYRVDRSRTQATGGAGLGLTIVKQLVEAHGGRVWAQSTPGKGTAFVFTLPTTGSGQSPHI